MPGCGITSGIGIDCEDLRRVGGVGKSFFAYNITDLAALKYTIDGDGNITAINFDAYAGLYEFTGQKKSHSGGWSLQKQQPGGTTFFQHDVIVKLFPGTSPEDAIIEDMVVSEMGMILLTNNNEYFLYGAENGMEATEGTQNTGQESATDVSDTLTFTGEEKTKPRRILITDFATTTAYLESLIA